MHETACVILVHISGAIQFAQRCRQRHLGGVFQDNPSFRIDGALAPLRGVAPMAFLFADVEVLRLTVHCVPKDKCPWIQHYRADPALPQRKAAGEADDDIGSVDHGRSSGSDGKRHNPSDLA